MQGFIWEVVYMTGLVFGLSYAMHHYAIKHGYEEEELDSFKKWDENDSSWGENASGNSFLDKWLQFGGGYYGIVALIHLIFLEVKQGREFVANWPGLEAYIESLSPAIIGAILAEQWQNFGMAIGWPADYFSRLPFIQIVVIFFATLGAYELAKELVFRKKKR